MKSYNLNADILYFDINYISSVSVSSTPVSSSIILLNPIKVSGSNPWKNQLEEILLSRSACPYGLAENY